MAFELFLTRSERERMQSFPNEIAPDDLAVYFMLTDADRRIVERQRGDVGRLGFAITLCAVRFLGFAPAAPAPKLVVEFIASQLGCASIVDGYATRAKTRTAHVRRVLDYLGYRRAAASDLEELESWIAERASVYNRPSVLMFDACKRLYEQRIVRPGPTRLERIVSSARREAERRTHAALGGIIERSRRMLSQVLEVDPEMGDRTRLTWLRGRERRNSSPAMLRVLDKHKWLVQHEVATWDLEEKIHRNRRKYLVRLGASASSQMLRRMPERRCHPILIATLEQLLIDTTDDLLDMLDRRLLEIRVKARESLREHQDKARSERDEIVRSYEVITRVVLNHRIPAADIRKKIFDLIERADIERLRAAAKAGARPLDRDGLDFITNSYRSVRIFAARFLEQLELHPDPEAGQKPAVLEAVDVLREANRHGQRALPRDVSTEFASNQWRRFVSKGTGRKKVVDRKHFEIATLSSLGTALRSGEIWVENSRRYASPGSYLMPRERWASSKAEVVHQLGVEADAENALDAKVTSLTALGAEVERALIEGKLKRRTTSSGDEFVNPTLTKAPENESVDRLQKEVGLRMPRVELPSLLVEVDRWTCFSKQVAHPTHGRAPQGDGLLHFYAAILAQACNIGFTRMAGSCADVSVDQLTWTSNWFLHEEALRPAFAVLVDFQAAEPLGRVWGTGTLSSSDGQRFPVAGLIREARANRRYFGRRRGLTFYTSTNDQFGQYGIKVIPSTARDATYVLDEILDNETEAEILEHTVDTHGYTDILFALFDLLGMRFAPRIRDVADARLWGIEGLDPSIAKSLRVTRTIRRKRVVKSWDEMLRVAGSLKRNWVTASLLVTKLQAQPQRGVAGALLAYGRICKTEHVLRYFADEGYRRRIGEQLNKGEEIHGLRRFLFFGNRAQLSRKDAEALLSQAICLNIVSNAVVVWNTVYMGRVLDELRAEGFVVRDEDVARLSPCRFEHINHLGRYHFDSVPADGDFRPIARRRRRRG